MGKYEISKDIRDIVDAIVEKAKKEKTHKIIIEIIKNTKLSTVVRTYTAIRYMRELQNITKNTFFKSTLKKLSRSVKAIEECLKENGFTDTAKYIRLEWDKWIQNDLWDYLKEQKKLKEQKDTDTKSVSESDILKMYL